MREILFHFVSKPFLSFFQYKQKHLFLFVSELIATLGVIRFTKINSNNGVAK